VIVKGPDEYLGSDPSARAVFYAGADVTQRLPQLTRMGGGFCQLHDLRLVHGGQEAWIDHLLLHRYGFIVIESRTVCVPTLRDEEGRWFQLLRETSREVYSPIKRVRSCAEVVRSVLWQRQEDLFIGADKRDRVRHFEVDVFVSIAEAGVLITEGLGFSAVVVNAKQLTGLVNERHERRYFSELTSKRGSYIPRPLGLSTKELEKAARYLLSRHRPLERGAKYQGEQLERYYRLAA
jgi:hypothetical protein